MLAIFKNFTAACLNRYVEFFGHWYSKSQVKLRGDEHNCYGYVGVYARKVFRRAHSSTLSRDFFFNRNPKTQILLARSDGTASLRWIFT